MLARKVLASAVLTSHGRWADLRFYATQFLARFRPKSVEVRRTRQYWAEIAFHERAAGDRRLPALGRLMYCRAMTAVEQVVEIPFFQGLPAEALREVAARSSVLALHRGATLISQHAAADYVFFLISGSVQIYIHFHGVDDLLVGTMREAGALLGWSVVRKPHRYTATWCDARRGAGCCGCRAKF